jgi:1-acyl-sn-glycerol-3-phosphate acyltransferase
MAPTPPQWPRPVRMVVTVGVLLGMFLGWIVEWLLQLAAMAVMYPFSTRAQRHDVCSYIFHAAHCIIMVKLNPLWHLTILEPKPAAPKGAPYMYMFNHLGNADPFMSLYLTWPDSAKWVGKGSLYNIPFGGWCLRNNGDLQVKFTKEKGGWGTAKGSVRALMEDAAVVLRRNKPIGVFPEGARNTAPEGPVGEFKLGFFDLAIKENALIIPCALSGFEGYWPVHDWVLGDAMGYASWCAPISPKGHTAESLAALVHKTISKKRESHPDRVKAN